MSREEDYDYNIWVVNLGTGACAPWLSDGQRKRRPRVSPDGKHVAYDVRTGAGQSIWIADIDGSKPQQWSPVYPYQDAGNVYLAFGEWSPDGRLLAYRLHEWYDPSGAQLYVLTMGTQQARAIGPRGVHSVYGWVPGPKHEILIRDYEGDLYILDVDSEVLHPLVLASIPGCCGKQFGFTPDGKSLYGITSRVTGGTGRLVTMDPNGQTSRFISSEDKEVIEAIWTPDGRQVVFSASSYPSDRRAFYVADHDGQRERLLIAHRAFGYTDSASPILEGTWSPDEQWFGVRWVNVGDDKHEEMYLVHRDTGMFYRVPLTGKHPRDLDWGWLSQK